MLKKVKGLVLRGEKLGEYLEESRQFEQAYEEYLKTGSYARAGQVLEKLGKWHDAANLYINAKEIDRARRAIENCFKKNRSWESFDLEDGRTISIEYWLKKNEQTRRFVRYVRDVDILDRSGTPLIVVLAGKLKQASEFKGAAELYERAFHLVNDKRKQQFVRNEVWLRYASECYARAGLYDEASRSMRDLIMVEVKIGEQFSKESKSNPYRDYTFNLKVAREFSFLDKLIDLLADFDPFTMAYDLFKMGEMELSIKLFFRYYGKVSDRYFSEEEMKIRNEKISYCLNQYMLYYKEKKEYVRAAEIALMNSREKEAADLFKKSREKGKLDKERAVTPKKREPDIEIAMEREVEKKPLKCGHCGEEVDPGWKICPGCGKSVKLQVCACGQELKPHWIKCPRCLKDLHPQAD